MTKTRSEDGYDELDTWDSFGGDSLLMRDEIDRLRIELARTEGDLGVAIREAAAAREALKVVDALLTDAERIAAAIGRDYTGEGVEAWVRGEDLRPLVDAALDQRLTQ